MSFHPWLHFKTITKHRHLVIKHCFKCGIGLQGLFHDLSKYSLEEFIPSAGHYIGTKSPNEGERAEYGYSKAWLHHKGRNKHHFEYWMDYVPGVGLSAVEMPPKYIAEMFCDRVAASKTYQGAAYTDAHPLAYFERGRSRLLIAPKTSAALYNFLSILAKEGEDKAFAAIKAYLKEADTHDR